ncbi:nucleolar transcription factor 1-A-like [Pempheris klunzingeri]|uniref:nucleolar transcription factor 1-A-like n=1 Tax=Pempheris klunzingeri TaxID=3127111 RepID=UPI003980F75E
MSGIICSEESDWTKANLQRLLAALKAGIPEEDRLNAYHKGLKSVDWNKVAFPPFSPEECQKKWGEILQKMRKTRTLTDLIVEAEGAIDNPFHKRKIHPELPKRPCPPNAIFYEENCGMFQAEHPKMGRRELFKVLIKKYDALPDKKKAKYVEKHQLARTEYKRKMQEFREQYCTPSKCRQRQNKRELSKDNPDQNQGEQPNEVAEGLPSKPPFNGYNLFCKEQVQSMAGVSKKNYVCVWAQRWRDLTERQRDEYSTRSKDLKRQYSIELNEYLKTFDEEEQQRILDKYGLKRPNEKDMRRVGTIVKKFPGEPKMPPQSGNVFFFKDKMELLKDEFSNSKERLVKVSQLWQDLPNKERECYRQKIRRNVATYSVELQRWFKTLSADEQKAYLKLNPRKCKYLVELEAGDQKQQRVYIPSDSEDEDLEYSSSDEEEEVLESEEYEEEEDEDKLMFDMF